jgi:hypothetical protein
VAEPAIRFVACEATVQAEQAGFGMTNAVRLFAWV